MKGDFPMASIPYITFAANYLVEHFGGKINIVDNLGREPNKKAGNHHGCPPLIINQKFNKENCFLFLYSFLKMFQN